MIDALQLLGKAPTVPYPYRLRSVNIQLQFVYCSTTCSVVEPCLRLVRGGGTMSRRPATGCRNSYSTQTQPIQERNEIEIPNLAFLPRFSPFLVPISASISNTAQNLCDPGPTKALSTDPKKHVPSTKAMSRYILFILSSKPRHIHASAWTITHQSHEPVPSLSHNLYPRKLLESLKQKTQQSAFEDTVRLSIDMNTTEGPSPELAVGSHWSRGPSKILPFWDVTTSDLTVTLCDFGRVASPDSDDRSDRRHRQTRYN
ncbi:hypothetical protein PM082_019260 [Marasmius tenuissimus]|nr:hypothetical protein PM082_019260 [Marasmius tenuissimus]